MRKTLLLILALAMAAVGLAPVPLVQASACAWTCGPCGMVCPCDVCVGAKPVCPCLAPPAFLAGP